MEGMGKPVGPKRKAAKPLSLAAIRFTDGCAAACD
jgi:hypothetical protein